MNIYTPYFYVIQEISSGMYYAGAKWAKNAHPDNFMTEGGYTTSSNIINKIIEQNGLNSFIIRKIRTFETAEETYEYETRFLQRIDAARHPKFYNYNNNYGKFNTKGKVVVRDKNMNMFQIDVDDPRYLSGELIHNSKDRVTVFNNITKKTESVFKDDPRFSDGTLEYLVLVEGDKKWVSQSEYKKGNYVSRNANKVTIYKNDEYIMISKEDFETYKRNGWKCVSTLAKFTNKSSEKRKNTLLKVDENGKSGYEKRSEKYSKTVLTPNENGLTLSQKRSIKIANTRKKKIGKLKLFGAEGQYIDADYLLDLSRKYGIPRFCFDKCLSDGKGFFYNRPNVAKKKNLEFCIGWRVEKF